MVRGCDGRRRVSGICVKDGQMIYGSVSLIRVLVRSFVRACVSACVRVCVNV